MGFGYRGQRFVVCGSGATIALHASCGNDDAVDVRVPDRVVSLAPGGTVNV
jgi:hypothetical protein